MKKLGLFALVLCLLIAVTGCAIQLDDSPKKETGDPSTSTNGTTTGNQKEVFSLNETAVFKNIKVTANEIINNPGSEYLKPDEGKKYVAVKFTIENISEEEETISSILLFDAYADDVKCSQSISATMGLDGSLDGSLSPGKKLVGYYGVEVSKDAKKLNLEVKSSWLSSSKATFEFDIPN